MSSWFRHNEYKATWGTLFLAAVIAIKIFGIG